MLGQVRSLKAVGINFKDTGSAGGRRWPGALLDGASSGVEDLPTAELTEPAPA
jgi:hypothetical protein